MTRLKTDSNIANTDSIYEQLIELHQGCSDLESMCLNSRLILLLMNHIGDMEVLSEAMRQAADKNRRLFTSCGKEILQSTNIDTYQN